VYTNTDEPAPMVSVIVPHYNDLIGLDRCLTALERQTYPRDRFEIIVGDNNSPQGIDEVTRVAADRARVALITDKGAGPARNGALSLARFDTLALTDSDCVPDPQWLGRGVESLDRFDIVGGRMKVFPADPANVSPVECFELVFRFDNKRFVEKSRYTVTANLFTRKSVFDRIGGFAVSVISEDIDWCHRALAAGYTQGYRDDLLVNHPARPDWASLCKMQRRLDMEIFEFKATSVVARLGWLARVLAYPLSAVAHSPRVLLSANLKGLRQRLSALVVLYRIRWWRVGLGVNLLLSGDRL